MRHEAEHAVACQSGRCFSISFLCPFNRVGESTQIVRPKNKAVAMKSLCIITFFLVAASFPAIAGWEAKMVPKTSGVDGDRYVLIYQSDGDRGTKSISQAVDSLAKAGHIAALQTLTLHELVQDQTFQKEVFDQLEKIAPESLGAAKKSSGNMHNPKMTALHADFSRAVLNTPTITDFATALAAHGMKISRPSFEKLELRKIDHGFGFSCFLWMSVEPAAPASGAASRKP